MLVNPTHTLPSNRTQRLNIRDVKATTVQEEQGGYDTEQKTFVI